MYLAVNQLGPHGEVGINIVRCCSPPPGTADVVSGVSCTSHSSSIWVILP